MKDLLITALIVSVVLGYGAMFFVGRHIGEEQGFTRCIDWAQERLKREAE